MPYDQYLINRIKGAVRARDLAKVEELWMELQSSQTPIAELDIFLDLAGQVAERGDKERAAELLMLLKTDLKEAERDDELFALLRQAVRYSGRVRGVREDLVDQYKRVYGERPGFGAVLSRTDLAGEGRVRDAVQALDEAFCFTVGDYVFHGRGWGVGKVVEAHPETGEFVIDFSRRRGQKMEAGMALKALELRGEDDLDVLLWTNKDRVRDLAKSDPLTLLVSALKANGGKTTSRELKEKLTDILDKSGWTRFWAKARKLAKDDPTIEVGKAPRSVITLRDEPLSREEEIVESVRRNKDFHFRIATARTELTQIKKAAPGEPPAWLAPLLLLIGEHHGKAGSVAERAAKIEVAIYKSDVAGLYPALVPDVTPGEAQVDPETGEPVGETVPEHLKQVVDGLDAKTFPKVLKAITVPEHRRRMVKLATSILGEEAPKVLRAVLLNPAHGCWLAATTALKEAGQDSVIMEAVKALVVTPKKYPNGFTYYAKARLSGAVEFLGRSDAEILAKAIQVLDGEILRQKETKKKDDKTTIDTLRAIFTEKSNRVLHKVIGDGSEDEVRRILMLVRQSPALTDTVRRATESLVVERFPELLAALKGPDADEDLLPTLYCTAEGIKRRERELSKIIPGGEKFEQIRIEVGKALEFGDISENSELDAAREKQQQMADQAERMRSELERVKEIDFEAIDYEVASVGTRVSVVNTDTGEESIYTILGPWDVDERDETIISHMSPLAKGLIGKKAGESALVKLPGGDEATYEVKSIDKAVLQGA
jgi:transcription elongation factor GreA